MTHLDIKTTIDMTGLSRTSIYKLISLGKLTPHRILRRTYITRKSLNLLLGVDSN